MLDQFRHIWAAVMAPPARLLLRLGVAPDVVTWIGTILVVAAALLTIPRGLLWQGALLCLITVLSDGLDGQMARMSSQSTTYGAFLDSSLDRVADGALFGAIILYYAGPGGSQAWAFVTLWALVAGQVTSYVKARAESVGLDATGGIAARADRIVVAFIGLILAGIGVPYALQIAMLVLALLATWTVGQRILRARASAGKEPFWSPESGRANGRPGRSTGRRSTPPPDAAEDGSAER
ncbi:MAG TPA: CDP-alcohol phosphatidyltransferase family protein [Propionibacteriaceae bacterium]|nr:CDP-alcohol phosphatidyltransferase family protein [Propionibacteriaceae bacterium]HPZ50077.1 CDP-alcohol phosphatidyltransferase family protein [Propionibacteriaceae bacterium]HQE32950.1 CDP-alcohol phosphatidyltransferase family protein [Propionibacteriaceae bacterium]